MKVLAGTVLFNPDIGRLKQNIEAIQSQVDAVVCVDNGSSNLSEIKAALPASIAYVENGANKGIAYALNRILQYADEQGFEWFITLDQDSVTRPGLIDQYKGYINLPDAGMLSCKIRDRNFSADGLAQTIAESQEAVEIQECITSAAFNKTSALKAVGGFDDRMFIDSVDFDICLNLRKHGYKVYKINFEGILHEVGHSKRVKLLWKNRLVFNHSPLRNYYMARNQYYMAKKYPADISMTRVWVKELERRLLIWLYEDNQTEKLRARRLGVKDGKRMKMGECTWL